MLDINYVAGYFDGEGSASIHKYLHPETKRVKSYSIMVQLTNTYLPTLLELKEQFGGSICEAHKSNTNPLHRKTWVWHIHGDKAREFLALIIPHLQEKKPQAQMVLDFPRLVNGKQGDVSAIRKVQEDTWLEVRRLKKLDYASYMSS